MRTLTQMQHKMPGSDVPSPEIKEKIPEATYLTQFSLSFNSRNQVASLLENMFHYGVYQMQLKVGIQLQLYSHIPVVKTHHLTRWGSLLLKERKDKEMITKWVIPPYPATELWWKRESEGTDQTGAEGQLQGLGKAFSGLLLERGTGWITAKLLWHTGAAVERYHTELSVTPKWTGAYERW